MGSSVFRVAFTGPRDIPAGMPVEEFFHREMERLEAEGLEVRAMVGGAAGTDTVAARVCADRGVPFTLALPHREYASRYDLLADAEWCALREKAARVVYVTAEGPFTGACNFRRNRWMVHHADLLLGAFGGRIDTISASARPRGGTAHAIQCALLEDVPLRVLTHGRSDWVVRTFGGA